MNRRAPIIAGAVFVVLAILGVVLLVLPKMGDVGEAEDRLAQAETEEDALRGELARMESYRDEAPEAEAKIRKLETKIPPTADLPGMIRLLSQAADRSAVEFFSIAPGAPTPDASGGFSIVSTSVTVNGEYFSLEEFLYNLENLPRAAKVMTVTLGEAAADAVGALSMQLTVELYTTDPDAGPSSDPAPGESFAGISTGA